MYFKINVVYCVFTEEAENERMHLMTALQLKQPSRLFRLGVVGTQGNVVHFYPAFFITK